MRKVWTAIMVVCVMAIVVVWNHNNISNFNRFKDQLFEIDVNEVITEGVSDNKNALRIENIRQYCISKGFEDVTKEQIIETINELAGRNYKAVINDSPFLMTVSLLNKKLDDLVWPKTAKSYANDTDGTRIVTNYISQNECNRLYLDNKDDSICTQVQKLSISEQLEAGIRCIELDIGPRMNLKQIKSAKAIDMNNVTIDWDIVDCYNRNGLLGRTSIKSIIKSVQEFITTNPNEVLMININNIYDGKGAVLKKDDKYYNEIQIKFLEILKKEGLLSQAINYMGDDNTVGNDLLARIMYPGKKLEETQISEWPKLSELILNDKRIVIILPEYVDGINNISFNEDNHKMNYYQINEMQVKGKINFAQISYYNTNDRNIVDSCNRVNIERNGQLWRLGAVAERFYWK